MTTEGFKVGLLNDAELWFVTVHSEDKIDKVAEVIKTGSIMIVLEFIGNGDFSCYFDNNYPKEIKIKSILKIVDIMPNIEDDFDILVENNNVMEIKKGKIPDNVKRYAIGTSENHKGLLEMFNNCECEH